MFKYDIFLICPVREATEEQIEQIVEYISKLEEKGLSVYYPAKDTNQNDAIGWDICKSNHIAMKSSKEVHVFWNKDSKGSLFDLGMAFSLNKHLVIANPKNVSQTENKSFENLIRYWQYVHLTE